MFNTLKRRRLMWHFKCIEVRFRAEQLGWQMATSEGDSARVAARERLHEAIQEVCAKRGIGPEEMNLVEDDLNAYINRLVRKSYEENKRIQGMRELVDSRIKIKRVDRPELDRRPSDRS